MINLNANKFFFIINPNAGNGKSKKEWIKITKLISCENINYDFSFTKYIGNAEEIVTKKIYEGYKKFVVVGGDGTLNEVVNGIFKQKQVKTTDIYLGLFSMGTGNDWARYYNFSNDYNESIDRIKWEDSKLQDIGKVTYYINNQQKEAFFINVAGLCFDSIVVNETNKMKIRGRRSKASYLSSLLKSLLKYKAQKLKIFINNKTIEGDFLSLSIGNGKYSGGGMIQTPNAVIDDGLFDVTIYPKMNKLKIITSVNKLYNGKIYNIQNIQNLKTSNLKIEANNNIFAETDGEIIGGPPYEFSIIPKALNVFV